jgi:hypothetical protein
MGKKSKLTILQSEGGSFIQSRGAGILILELYKGNPVFTLFGKNMANYSDLGGKSDPGEKPEETAHRESREESANLINISPYEINNYTVPIVHNQYLSYIIYVEGVYFSDYAHNVNHIQQNCRGKKLKFWKETNSMARIPLNNMLTAAQNYLDYAVDVMGNPVNIRKRTMGIVRDAYSVLSNFMSFKPLKLYKHLVTSSHLPCLIGTYTYTVNPTSVYTQPQISVTSSEKKHPVKYAVYLVPDLDEKSAPYLSNCDRESGGMHIEITGFHENQPPIKKFIKHLSNQGENEWTITLSKIKVKGKTIYFSSHTLDQVAKFLKKNDFEKVRGPKYTDEKWNITSECNVPKNIKTILKNQTWSLAVAKKKKGNITLEDFYPLNIL